MIKSIMLTYKEEKIRFLSLLFIIPLMMFSMIFFIAPESAGSFFNISTFAILLTILYVNISFWIKEHKIRIHQLSKYDKNLFFISGKIDGAFFSILLLLLYVFS